MPEIMRIMSPLRNSARSYLRVGYHYLFPNAVFRRYINNTDDDEIEMDYLEMLVDRSKGAIDVGANFGRYTVHLAALTSHVWAFEPHPRLAYILRKSLPANVTVRQAAVSSQRGRTVLNVPLQRGQQAESLATIERAQGTRWHREITVRTVCLDDFTKHEIGFVKIDVEGHEIDVILGALDLLRVRRPILLIEADERHRKSSVQELVKLMMSAGYQGGFLYDGEFHNIENFRASDMQNERNLLPGVPRKSCAYVNNFIFAPNDSWYLLRNQLSLACRRKSADKADRMDRNLLGLR